MVVLLAILLLALGLRLVHLNQGFWLDEAIGVVAANQFSFGELISEFPKFDNHPPLYYLLLKLWSSFFGYSEVAVRLLGILFGVGTVIVVYAIAKELQKQKTKNIKHNWKGWPLISALFLATAPLHVYYSQEARMYPLAAFAASLAIYFFVRVLKEGGLLDWVAFSVSLIFLAASDYVPLFLFPVFFIVPFLLKKGTGWYKKLIISHLPLVILALAWFPIFAIQSQQGQWLLATLPAWRDIAGGATLKQAALVWIKFSIGRISFFNKIVYGSAVTLASMPLALALLWAWLRRRKEHLVLWAWLVVPLVLGFLASFFIPAFSFFRFLYLLPAFYLLIALGAVRQLADRKWWGRFLVTGVMIVNLFGWGVYATQERFQREDWRSAVSFVEANATQEDVVLFEFSEPFAPYRWYATGRVDAVGAFSSIRASEEDKERVRALVEGKSGIYHFIYLRDLSDPQKILGSTLVDEGFYQANVYNFRGIGHVVHWRKASEMINE